MDSFSSMKPGFAEDIMKLWNEQAIVPKQETEEPSGSSKIIAEARGVCEVIAEASGGWEDSSWSDPMESCWYSSWNQADWYEVEPQKEPPPWRVPQELPPPPSSAKAPASSSSSTAAGSSSSTADGSTKPAKRPGKNKERGGKNKEWYNEWYANR